MASGPYFDRRRGTWSVQWKDGAKWRRVVVVDRRPDWKPGDPAPKRPPAEATLALAEYTRREKTSLGGFDWNTPVSDFLAEYLRQRTLDRRPDTIAGLTRAIDDFLAWCESKNVHMLSEVSPILCQDFCNHWRLNGRGLSYVKTQKALLQPAWRRAARLGRLAMNPWPAVEVAGKVARKPFTAWTPDEFDFLIEECPPWLADVVTLGCHCGLRISALIGLEWSHIRWGSAEGPDYGEIVVPVELDKAGTGYSVPIHWRAHEVLARRYAARPASHQRVLGNRYNKPIPHDSSTYCGIRVASEKAQLGLPVSPNHAMRRTFGRWAYFGQLTGRPIDIYTVSRWMGHHSIEMTQRYLDLDPKLSREAMRDERRATPAQDARAAG